MTDCVCSFCEMHLSTIGQKGDVWSAHVPYTIRMHACIRLHGCETGGPMLDLTNKRFLIGEDEPMQAFLLHSLLSREGLEVVGIAQNGLETIAMALEKRPDIILSDIEMPDMDGLTAAQHILAEYPACVIFITGCNDEHSRQQAVLLGAAGYIHKPYRCRLLMQQLQEMVEHWQGEQARPPTEPGEGVG